MGPDPDPTVGHKDARVSVRPTGPGSPPASSRRNQAPAATGTLLPRVQEILRRYRELDPPPATREEGLDALDRIAAQVESE